MISENFSRSEFACGCGCGFNAVDIELVCLLEKVRSRFKNTITITSACRCAKHNKKVGGTDGSKHKLGIAADIVVKNTKPMEVYSFLCTCAGDKYGIGSYDNFTHIDVRQDKARW